MGPPQRLDGYLLVAGNIEFNGQTLQALAPIQDVAAHTAPAWQVPAAARPSTAVQPWSTSEARVPVLA
jgi:hypothetical protein